MNRICGHNLVGRVVPEPFRSFWRLAVANSQSTTRSEEFTALVTFCADDVYAFIIFHLYFGGFWQAIGGLSSHSWTFPSAWSKGFTWRPSFSCYIFVAWYLCNSGYGFKVRAVPTSGQNHHAPLGWLISCGKPKFWRLMLYMLIMIWTMVCDMI